MGASRTEVGNVFGPAQTMMHQQQQPHQQQKKKERQYHLQPHVRVHHAHHVYHGHLSNHNNNHNSATSASVLGSNKTHSGTCTDEAVFVQPRAGPPYLPTLSLLPLALSTAFSSFSYPSSPSSSFPSSSPASSATRPLPLPSNQRLSAPPPSPGSLSHFPSIQQGRRRTRQRRRLRRHSAIMALSMEAATVHTTGTGVSSYGSAPLPISHTQADPDQGSVEAPQITHEQHSGYTCSPHRFSSSHQFPSELSHPILEEACGDSESDPTEPVTPTSGRHSHDFPTWTNHDDQQNHTQTSHSHADPATGLSNSFTKPSQFPLLEAITPTQTPPIRAATSAPRTPPRAGTDLSEASYSSAELSQSPPKQTETSKSAAAPAAPAESAEQQGSPSTTPQRRRSTLGSASGFRRTMSSLFRRTNSSSLKDMVSEKNHEPDQQAANSNTAAVAQTAQDDNAGADKSNQQQPPPPPPSSGARFSFYSKSSSTNNSKTPSVPPSPTASNRNSVIMDNHEKLPDQNDLFGHKKQRSATGLTLRGRAVNFVGSVRGGRPRGPRRASSFNASPTTDAGFHPVIASPPIVTRDDHDAHASEGMSGGIQETIRRSPWAMAPDEGTGVKARRMSLSLPDDFFVDVADLQDEYEYQSKLGRHGKVLGRGAASKVTMMARKGSPGELYAVKEFRPKSNSESQEEYEKKIKSEYSISKSLHNPCIVDTVRLCVDHGRWNHVMEYCSEGDLFGAVEKGYLKREDRLKDRLCLFKQLVQGVHYLHANGIAHRDIKLENLLLTRDSKLKIIDFGVSEVFSGTHPGLRESGGQCGQNMSGEVRMCQPGICGSEPYIAPEVLAKQGEYDPRALDVWSSAIVMVYLVFGGAIWEKAVPNVGQVHYDKLVSGWSKWYAKHEDGADANAKASTESTSGGDGKDDEPPQITETDYPNHFALDRMMNPPALRRLVLQMLNPDPKRRITIEEVVHHRWMRNIECCQPESYDDNPSPSIDVSKKDSSRNGLKKIFCHNHLPPKTGGKGLHI